MIQSVERHSSAKIEWEILALDEAVYHFLKQLNKKNLNVMSFEDLNDLQLHALFGNRPWNEICWTSAACLLNTVLNRSNDDVLVGYVDADCYFFGDILNFFKDMSNGFEIFIHEHRFSKDRAEWLFKSGRFNVGLVGGKNGFNFRKCISVWRDQVLNDCSVNKDLGKCGDQTYLNDWPEKYSTLSIVEDIGAGVAPWNLNSYTLTDIEGRPYVNGVPVLFYHFHGLKFGFVNRFLSIYFPAPGYHLQRSVNRVIYREYLKHVIRINSELPMASLSTRLMPIKWFFRHVNRIVFVQTVLRLKWNEQEID